MRTVVTGLAAFKAYHRMIHRCVGEGAAGILMAAITIGFRAGVNDRDVGAIRVIAYIRYTRSARSMAAGGLAAVGHACVVEGRGSGERRRGMAGPAVRARHNMVRRFAGGAEDGAAMTVGTRLTGHFGAAVFESASRKLCRCWWMSGVAGRTVARGWHMVLRLARCIRAIVTGCAGSGQCVIDVAHIQCRVIEGRGKVTAGFMAILAYGRR